LASIDTEALSGMSAAVASLFPPPEREELATGLVVSAARITPTGVGGYVAPSASPVGDVLGRRVTADLRLIVRADTGPELEAAMNGLTTALLGAERRTLLEKGIQKLSLAGLGQRVIPGGEEESALATWDVGVAVVYEHLKTPEEPAGVIESIPMAIEAGTGERLARLEFAADPLAQFDLVDDPQAGTGGPSEWAWDGAQGRLEQRSAIRGGQANAPADRAGTLAVLKASAGGEAVADCVVEAWLGADAAGGIGVVFGYRDPANYAFALLDAARGERVIAVKAGGVFRPLQAPAFDASAGFATGTTHHLRVAVRGGRVEAWLDGVRVLAGQDTVLETAGRVGFIARHAETAFYHGLGLTRL
jgi:hypothetical protein